MTVDIFCRVGLEMNLKKTRSMVCTPVFIWGKIREEAYKRRATGEGSDVSGEEMDEGKFIRVWGFSGGSSLRHHMEISHGIIPT